jgi:hypothetical protein
MTNVSFEKIDKSISTICQKYISLTYIFENNRNLYLKTGGVYCKNKMTQAKCNMEDIEKDFDALFQSIILQHDNDTIDNDNFQFNHFD